MENDFNFDNYEHFSETPKIIIESVTEGGNPDVMEGVAPGMIFGVNTEAIAGNGIRLLLFILVLLELLLLLFIAIIVTVDIWGKHRSYCRYSLLLL
jgi:hypothetical protein